ncbi:MAG: relaxase [Pseudomonadota bacterium]
MLIKMSQRSGARNLAKHLLNTKDNEHVTVHELRHFSADNLTDALNEIHVQRLANKKIKSELVSMSLNPPIGETVSVDMFQDAANRVENELGLSNQPRAIVLHSKEGRTHAHVVWSRIDEHLKAIKLPFYKKKLQTLSKELYLENGWSLPKGMQNKQARSHTNYDLADAHIAKRQKRDPKQIKALVRALWDNAPDATTFIQAIEKEQFRLARGDNKRAIILVDIHGDIRALTRTAGIKAKEVKAKLRKDIDLPSIETAKASFQDVHKIEYERRLQDMIKRQTQQLAPHQKVIDRLVEDQRKARIALENTHFARQTQERQARQAQYKKGLHGLWRFVTGKYHKQKKQHEAEFAAGKVRDKNEMEELQQQQLREREKLQAPIHALKQQHQQAIALFNSRFLESSNELNMKETLEHAHTHKASNKQRIKPQELGL